MTPLERLSRITTSLGRASELTLQRIETELGLTPRPESPDAGRPYEAVQATSLLGYHDGLMDDDLIAAAFGPPKKCGDQCAYLRWPSCPLVDCRCIEARDMLRDAPMTPVRERGVHE